MKHELGKAVVFMCCEDVKEENKNFNCKSVLSSWLLSNHSFSPEVFLQKRNLSVSCSFSLAFFFFSKYKLLKMFYFVFFSTKRVDHSNTRLASQLDRNPGNSPVCNEASQRICFMCLFLYTYPCMHTHSQRS